MKTTNLTETEIKFTAEADPLKTQRRIKREVSRILNAGRMMHHTPKWTEACDVTEGVEKCGYGALLIRGTVTYWNGFIKETHTLENNGSQWRVFGHPSGTKYHVSILLKMKLAALSDAAQSVLDAYAQGRISASM